MAADGDLSVGTHGNVRKIETSRIPKHVAIIMDGNGRWASKRKLPKSVGHKKGSEAVKEAISGAIKSGVKYLTLYAFSTENWNRPQDEVQDLMGLLRFYLKREIKELHKENVKLHVLGEKSALDAEITKLIDDAEALTADNDRLTLVIALNYGSRQEILKAVQAIAQKVEEGALSTKAITLETLDDALLTKEIPDPDLVIRTSGEQRLSNFLLWQVAYSELYFSDVLWPDFAEQHFIDAVIEYGGRERRFGARPDDEIITDTVA
ncbi:isoprenyl transferase [Kordiimonas sp. SCSIO 12610]|uniref:isoprenyl transferase n=1 Tax=Kordiimonas sp. SCSIO 12610 TaxID=2829597 RepID=UPI00210AF8FD|nr:isoprenyl transferase [Kordiimonas sp. SCSIO 12610]UTW54052.1 isoprenyl transferase [Kordiimonas sp. SCSIO 12610]